MADIDFSDTWPYSEIRDVTIDGQQMVKIPKFYFKTFDAPAASKYAGGFCRVISDTKLDGFHIHPAFMKNGIEKNYFYIGAYEASADGNKACSLPGKIPWGKITNPAAISACNARNTGMAGSEQSGWHLQTVYERAAVALLMMIEFGTPNVQNAIAAGNSSSSAMWATGTTTANWRGIHEFWGNTWEYTDGVKTDANTCIQIFDNKGYGTYKNTNVVLPTGWIKETSRATGDGFDLGDVFIPSTVSSSESNGTYCDYSFALKNCIFCQSGFWGYGREDGAFTIGARADVSFSHIDIGFRIAKI